MPLSTSPISAVLSSVSNAIPSVDPAANCTVALNCTRPPAGALYDVRPYLGDDPTEPTKYHAR